MTLRTWREDGRLGVLFGVLALSAATYSVFQSVLIPALPEVRHELDASAAATTWLITGYLVTASVATPIAGNLGDLLGRRRVLVAVLSACAGGTVLAAAAESVGMLIAGRAIQGLAGAVFPLAFAIIRDAFPPARVAKGIAMISSILGVGGVVGITLAGPIVDTWGYQWLFWLPLGLVMTAAAAAHLVVPDSPRSSRTDIDWSGAALMVGWLVALLVAISEGPQWGWGSARQLALLAVGGAILALWVAFERRASDPMIDMRLMAHRPVWTANAAGLLYGYCLFTWIVLVPQFVATPPSAGYGFGASVAAAGLFLLPSTATMVLIGPVTGWIVTTAGPKLALLLGIAGAALALAILAFAHEAPWQIYLAATLLGAGNGLAYGTLPNLIVNAVRQERTGTATGMNIVFRNIGGALGSQVAVSIVAATTIGTHPPAESAFTVACSIAVGAALLGLVVTSITPRRVVELDVIPRAVPTVTK